MECLYFLLGISAGIFLKLILYSDDVSRWKLFLAALFSALILGILFLLEQKNCSEIPAKKNNSESSCWFHLGKSKTLIASYAYRSPSNCLCPNQNSGGTK